MLIKIIENVFFRWYKDIGFITNKNLLRERVVDINGAVFLSCLSKKPKNLEDVLSEISDYFIDTPLEFEKDVLDFFEIMEQDRFLVTGADLNELFIKEKKYLGNRHSDKKEAGIKLLRAKESTESFLDTYFKDKPSLLSLQIEITNRCNERCVHCYIPHEDKIKDMDCEMFKKIIDSAEQMGVIGLSISGGEPMQHENFCDFLNILSERDFYISVLSNLTLLSEKEIHLLKKTNATVAVSLYSTDYDTHDTITKVKGSCKKTMDSIKQLRENDITVMVNCPVMEENKNDVEKTLEWGNENGIKIATDLVMMARYDGNTDNLEHRINLQDSEKLVKKIIRNNNIDKSEIVELEKTIKNSLKSDRENQSPCGAGTSYVSINVKGDVIPCAGWQSYVFGNINETALEDLWENSEELKKIRRIKKKDFVKCRDCEDEEYCSICMARNANESSTNDPFEITEHYCKVAHINRLLVENCD